MTTGRKDVVFIILDGVRVVPWNVVDKRVLMLNVPGAKEDFENKGVEVEEMEVSGTDGESIGVLAIGVGELGKIFSNAVVVKQGDAKWRELFERQGLSERSGYGEYVRGKWGWGGVDPKKK